MKLFASHITTLIVFCCFSSTALATSYRLDFSGTIFGTNESYSGYAIFDSSVPNSGNTPTVGEYENVITDFEMQFGGTSYFLDQGAPNGIFIVNDDVFYDADLFSFSVELTDTDGNSAEPVFFQLVDPSMTAFNSVELPLSLAISDFAQMTGSFFETGTLFGSNDYNSIDFVQISAVPLPAGLVLFLSGLGAFFGMGYRKRA